MRIPGTQPACRKADLIIHHADFCCLLHPCPLPVSPPPAPEPDPAADGPRVPILLSLHASLQRPWPSPQGVLIALPPPNSVGSGFTQDVPGARSPAGLPVASPGPLHRCSPPQSMFTHTEAHTCRVTERLAFSTWMSQKRDLPSRVALTWNDIVKARVACALLSCVREMGHMLTQELLESAGF